MEKSPQTVSKCANCCFNSLYWQVEATHMDLVETIPSEALQLKFVAEKHPGNCSQKLILYVDNCLRV